MSLENIVRNSIKETKEGEFKKVKTPFKPWLSW